MSEPAAPPDASNAAPMAVDLIEIHCNGCTRIRVYELDTPIVGAAALIAWMKTKPRPCECGAKTGDVKARLMRRD